MSSPTQRTLKKWRDAGYIAGVVERWNPHARVRQDLFGFVDIVAVGEEGTIGIQACHYSDVSKRVQKIESMPGTVGVLREAGWTLLVEGWHKPRHRWVCRTVDVS